MNLRIAGCHNFSAESFASVQGNVCEDALMQVLGDEVLHSFTYTKLLENLLSSFKYVLNIFQF